MLKDEPLGQVQNFICSNLGHNLKSDFDFKRPLGQRADTFQHYLSGQHPRGSSHSCTQACKACD